MVLACRSAERGRAAAEALAAANTSDSGLPCTSSASGGAQSSGDPSKPRVEVELLDLASLPSVRQFVWRWAASGRPLDLLICK